MSKNVRLKRSREYAGISQIDLAKKIGLQGRSYIAQLESGEKEFTFKQAVKLAKALNINPEWLWTGEGAQEATKGDTPEIANGAGLHPVVSEGKGVPYYDIDVTGSIVGSFSDLDEKPEFFVDFKPFNDCKAWMPIYGDSMFPRFQSGEIVAIKEVRNVEGIQWGEAHLVITDGTYDLRTVKTIHPYEKDESKIVLRATNPNYKGDTIITKASIVSLFIVKGKVTRFQI